MGKGCSEPEVPYAKQYGHTDSFMLNLPMALECVLFPWPKTYSGPAGVW